MRTVDTQNNNWMQSTGRFADRRTYRAAAVGAGGVVGSAGGAALSCGSAPASLVDILHEPVQWAVHTGTAKHSKNVARGSHIHRTVNSESAHIPAPGLKVNV